MNKYLSSPLDIKINTPSSRYIDDSSERLSPRDEGIMLHKVFENASSLKDIEIAIEALHIDGLLSRQECSTLITQVEQALDNTIAGRWFDGSWKSIRRECNIISGNDTRRPDRVMISDDEAVVVDYKFGQEEKIYRRQISEYISLLRQMGYKKVSGYIWYVRESRIEEVI